MESRPMAVKAQSPNHWTAREFPSHKVIFKERKQKVYPFPDKDVPNMLEQLLQTKVIKLPNASD